MKDQIILEQDENGNYKVDIIGLMYLLKKDELPENSEVLMEYQDGEQVSYVVCAEESGSFLIADDGYDSLFELDEDSLHAIYYIDTEAGEDVVEKVTARDQKEHLDSIHYEEALMRMEKGEKVYLDYGIEFQMKLMDKHKDLTPAMILEGIWFTSERLRGKKEQSLNEENEDKLESLLSQYLAEHEKEVAQSKRSVLPKQSAKDEEDMMKFFKMLETPPSKDEEEDTDALEEELIRKLVEMLLTGEIEIRLETEDEDDDYY